MPQQNILDFYKRPATMTSAGEYGAMLEQLPNDVGVLTDIVQGLLIHEYMASAYGVQVPDERKSESHLRPTVQMLEKLFEQNDKPLAEARLPEERLVGICRHFAVLFVALLRAKDIPARARCGYGTYFNPGFFENHWVCEYWNERETRWVIVDAQFDQIWQEKLKIDHNAMDLPRDRFIIAGEAWTKCRTGEFDASRFGIFKGDLRGLWFVAGDIVRDVAALNKLEMLAWDVWGAMPKPNETLTDDLLAFFDRLAALTRNSDDSFDELRQIYESDERLRVPKTVFNSLLSRPEIITQTAGEL